MRLAFLVLLALPAALAAWNASCVTEPGCPTIMMSVGCTRPDFCAIVGGYSNTPFGVYYTKDNFQTFTRAAAPSQSLMLMDIAVDSNGHGATCGMGVGNSSALQYSSDMTTWLPSSEQDMTVGQDIKATGAGQFLFVGTRAVENDQGAMFSEDGGKTYTMAKWSDELNNATQARYGARPSANVLYITGGHWPRNRRQRLEDNKAGCARLTSRFCVQHHATPYAAMNVHNARVYDVDRSGYYGVITKSTDGGKTWRKLFEDEGRFYFNDISCANDKICYAVAEGFGDDGSRDGGARVFRTTDGESWSQVFRDEHSKSSLFRIEAISDKEAWAMGGFVKDGIAYGTFYHTVDGGNTWDLDDTVQYVGMITGSHFLSKGVAYAVGVTQFQTSAVMRYAP